MALQSVTINRLELSINDKTVEIVTPRSQNLELHKALLDEQQFRRFASDPAAYVREFGFTIDQDLAVILKETLKGVLSLDHLHEVLGRKCPRPSVVIAWGPEDGGSNPYGTTVWAVASGAYSVASSKIAVAF